MPEEAVALRVRLTTACAGVEHLLGRHEDAYGRLIRALEGLEDADSPEAAALMIELALDGVYRMEFEQIAPWARRALELARPLGDRPLTASAVAILAWGEALCGRVDEAETYRAEAAALVDSLSDEELALRLDAAMNLAGAELYLDRFDECGVHAERVVAVARATGQPAIVLFAFMLVAWVRMLRGELAEGGEMLDAAIEEARLLGNAQSLAGLLLNRSLTALGAGDAELAVRTAEESVELTRGDGQRPHSGGNRPGARRRAPRDRRPGPRRRRRAHARTHGRRRDTAHARGKLSGEVARAPDALLAGAGPSGGRRACCRVCRDHRGLDGIAPNGDLDGGSRSGSRRPRVRRCRVTAAERALASAAAADDVGVPVEAGLSRMLAGRALAQAGERERAIAELEQAASAFHACGARRYRDAADHELRLLGRRVHRRTQPGQADATGVATLTKREEQIARLVVDRRTNPEIAETLFLSPKTVETHMRNIFRKLDVASRADVAGPSSAPITSVCRTRGSRAPDRDRVRTWNRAAKSRRKVAAETLSRSMGVDHG